MNNIAREVREFVREECKKSSSNYSCRPFESHFKPVFKYGQELAEELNSDKEIVTTAAWLRDIGPIIEKLGNKWGPLTLEKSKNLIKPKYEAARLLLK